MQETYKRRYISLKRKCDSLEMSNERVLNRLFHVKKYIHKLSRERRGLAKKLTELGDEFKKSDLTVPLEDELPGAMIGAAESPSSSGPAMAENAAVFSPFSQGGPTKGEETLSLKDTPQTPAVQGKPGRKKRSRDVNKPEREKDPNAPKKPANAFLMYCQQERQKVQDGEGNGIYSADLSHQDLTRQLAKQWKFLSEEEKKHYYLMYEKEKDRYDKAVKKYAKGAGNDKKKASRDNGHDGDSEMIDVVKMGQEKDWKLKDFREEKITLKTSHTSEDQTIDVEKDEFEFSDPHGMAEEPKICLEKIDKSKLFDKARLFGFPSLASQEQVPNVSKAESDGKQQLRDLFMKTDVRPFSRSPQPSYKGPAILEIATGRKSASPTILSHAAPKMLPEAPLRPSMDLSIKELVGARPGSFELRNPAMMELKSKGEERTVLASALQNKPMFDIKMRSSTDYTKSKPILDVTGPSSDTSSSWGILSSDLKSKVPLEMKSRLSAEQEKPKTLADSSPRTFTESKTTITSELRSKPSILETTKSSSPLESRVRGSPETMRRLSLDNKRAVVELKKIPVDPSDDPYHFDD